MNEDYHKYFIQDGRHVGDYEGMYRNCRDPWRIEELGLRLDMRAALLLLEDREALFNNILDIGSGLGFFSDLLMKHISAKNSQAHFVLSDISPTAAEKLSLRFSGPKVSIQAFDLRKPFNPFPGKFDLVVMAQVLWGLLEDLPRALGNLAGLVRPKGFLLISQHFPGRDQQSYGRDLVSRPEELAEKVADSGFTLLAALESNRFCNHHWASLWRKN